jgi:hypothetical protein
MPKTETPRRLQPSRNGATERRPTAAERRRLDRVERTDLETGEAQDELETIASQVRALIPRLDALATRVIGLEAHELIMPVAVHLHASRTVLPATHELLAAIHRFQGAVWHYWREPEDLGLDANDAQ